MVRVDIVLCVVLLFLCCAIAQNSSPRKTFIYSNSNSRNQPNIIYGYSFYYVSNIVLLMMSKCDKYDVLPVARVSLGGCVTLKLLFWVIMQLHVVSIQSINACRVCAIGKMII